MSSRRLRKNLVYGFTSTALTARLPVSTKRSARSFAVSNGLIRFRSIRTNGFTCPIDSGCLLFRDEANARAAFAFDSADYIKVHEENADEAFAFWNYGPELSRRFRALKIWLTLRYYGTQRIANAISEDNALAKYFGEQVEAAEDFELLGQAAVEHLLFSLRSV